MEMANVGIAEQQMQRQKLVDLIPLNTPLQMQIELASACNFKCRFCMHHDNSYAANKGMKHGIMNWDTFRAALEGIKKFPNRIKLINLQSRGESLLNKDIGEMLVELKNADVAEKIGLYTNGSLLSKDMTNKLVMGGVNVVHISIEGVSSEQYRTISGVDIDFDELVANVKYFYENKKQAYLYVKTMDNGLSDEDKEKFYSIFGGIADSVFIENPVGAWIGAGIDDKFLKKDRYRVNTERVKICPRLFFALVVHYDGTVVACDHDWAEQYPLGNVFDESVYDLWNGDRLRDLRKLHMDGNADDIERCKSCVSRMECLRQDNIDVLMKRREEIKI